MADITGGFNRNMPSGSSNPNLGDDLLRQHWTSIQSTMEEEHFMNDSTASAGIHKVGSGKIHIGTESQVSTGGADDHGRVMFSTDAEKLYVLQTSSVVTLPGTRTDSLTSFGGAKAFNNTSQTDFVAGSSVFFSLGSEAFDRGGFYTSGSSIIVPSGYSGVYQVEAGCQMFNQVNLATGDDITLVIDRGAPAGPVVRSIVSNVEVFNMHVSTVIHLSDGSWVAAALGHAHTSNLSTLGGELGQWLSLTRLDHS